MTHPEYTPYAKKLIEELSHEQVKPLYTYRRHNLTLAGPGTGKTHMFVRMVAFVKEMEPNAKIRMSTFTNKSTDEMKTRIEKVVQIERQNGLFVSTLHSLILELRRKLGTYKLLAGTKQIKKITRALNNLNSDIKRKDAISLIDQCGRSREDYFMSSDKVKALYDEYLRLLSAEGYEDLNLATQKVVHALENKQIKPLDIDYLFIDEFQDTDDMQLQVIVAHGLNGTLINAVADDDQSIYGFRGGKGYVNLQKLRQALDCKTNILSMSFRCAKNIIYVANQIIKFNTNRIEKEMNATRDFEGKVDFYHYRDIEEEAEDIVRKIANQKGWAVLARNNSLLKSVEAELELKNIPVYKLSDKSIWADPEVSMHVSILELLLRPGDVSNVAFFLSLLHVSGHVIDSMPMPTRHLNQVMANGDVLRELDDHGLRMLSLLLEQQKDMERESNIEAFLQTYKKIISKLYIGKTGRSKESLGAEFVSKVIMKLHGNFAKRISALLEMVEKRKDKEEVIPENAVVLGTLHASKGLEFKNVWLMSMDKGVIPSPESVSDHAKTEEERCLAFVGITRAMDQLNISSKTEVSEFFQEAFPEQFKDPKTYLPIPKSNPLL